MLAADEIDVTTYIFSSDTKRAEKVRIVGTAEGQIDIYLGDREQIICLSVDNGHCEVYLTCENEEISATHRAVDGGWINVDQTAAEGDG